MCGISGIFGTPGHAQEPVWRTANQAMVAHHYDRGPDSNGIWEEGGVFLGHTRLAIMDPGSSDANQPVATDRYALAYNGEIYNFRNLRAELEGAGVAFATECDTEVLLKAIDLWGVAATLPKISGIFAFAVYDRLTRELHLVRDRLGIKPLYFHHGGDALWFASTPAAIARTAQERWALDYEGLYSFFRLGAPTGARTLFTGIERLAPAEHVRVDAGLQLYREIYWRPQPRKVDLTEAVTAAAEQQREAHVPSALFLSGGIDSSVLASIYRDIDLFHLESPERSFAEYVADQLSRDLRVREWEDLLEFDTLNEQYSASSGEPSASAPIPMVISRAMSEAGYKMAFSANGADELFFGYPRTPASELHPGNLPANTYESAPVASDMEQLNHIFRHRDSFSVPRAPDTDALHTDEWPYTQAPALGGGFPPSAAQRWFELQTYVAYDLNPTLDFASMACSLEVRVPFLDHELIEAVLSCDANQLIEPDYGRKAPLKRMLRSGGFHPRLWARPKLGFSISPEVLERRNASMAASREALREAGLLRIASSCRPGSRDDQYLASAGAALDVWRRVWIETGRVTL